MQPDGAEEIDKLFRQVDFAANDLGLQGRLWQRIATHLSKGPPLEQVVADEEMDYLTAAGETSYPLADIFQESIMKNKEK